MKARFRTCLGLLCCALLTACGADAEPDTQPSADTAQVAPPAPADTSSTETNSAELEGFMDESAITLLQAMTGELAGLATFAVTMEIGFDVLQPSGQKLEFGSHRTASIRRPDKARFVFQKRSGEVGEMILDGTNVWAYEREENVYASIEQPGDIDTSLEAITIGLGIPLPASDFFSADPSIALAAGVLEARDVGPSSLNNQAGRQIALRKPGVDYQIWVSESTSLPMRTVITYLEEPGQPQFWVQFLEWDKSPETADSAFEFSPPEGSERIRFATIDTSEEVAEDAQ